MPASFIWPLRRGFGFAMKAAMLFFILGSAHVRADQFDTLRAYWQNTMVGTNLSGSTLSSRASNANGYWSSMNTNASRTYLWSDIPLGSVSANISSTFNRLKTMALAWASPGCSLYGDTNLAAVVDGGLDWMAANSYTTTATEYDNWWDWEIGGAQAFNDTQVLMYSSLTPAEITNYNNSIDHFSPPTKSWDTGANLTDQDKVVLIRSIIGKNSGKMGYGQTNLSPVFPYVTSSDGFYRDGSFVQHTKIAYTGTYGIVLLGDIQQLVNLLYGSQWQITDPNLTNVYNWVVNSYEPVVYNGAMMDMVRGRAVSRYGEQESNDGSSAINDVRQIALFAPSALAVTFSNWAASPKLPPSQYQFADMDRVVSWRSNFCFSLSMSSTRIANYECINGENLHGWFTGDGMTYLYIGSPDTQYTGDYWPTVDPYHLPGTTVDTTTRANASGEASTTSQNWVGGAQVSGSYGVAGMSLAAYGSSLVAKKSWFMFDNEVACLGAGITCGSSSEVDTTVEDRRLGATPTNNFTANGVQFSPANGLNSNLTTTAWCALDGVGGYYFPGGATNLQASFVTNTGSWYQINNGTYTATTTNVLTDCYLKLLFNHGVKPTNATYAYVLLPNLTVTGISNYAASPDIVVLTNNTLVQAVSKPSLGVVAANFWTNGTCTADLITVNKKASVITSESSLGLSVGVSDPTQTNKTTITVTLNRSAIATVSADPGVTVVQLSPQIILSVNVNGSLGKTYQASFISTGLTWDANTGTTGAQDGSGTWNGSTLNWWSGSADLAWNDSLPYIATFGSGGTAGTVTLANPHTAYALIFNPVASGSYTLAGTPVLTVSNGITANASAMVNAPLNLPSSQTWTMATNQTLNINGAITAPSSVALSLAGAGTLNLGGNNQVSTNINAINFVDTLNETTLGVSGNAMLYNLNLNDSVTGAVAGAGSLIVNGAADMKIGGETSAAAQTLDLSGLNSFSYTASNNTFGVGNQVNGISGTGTVYLAGTNTITANILGVQTTTGDTSTECSGYLYLGQNNTINANTINVSLVRANGTVNFQAGVINPALVIRASDGVSRANMTVGARGSSYFSSANASFDLTKNVTGLSQLDALVGSLKIAQEDYCLTTSDVLNGTFVMGGGQLDATNITIGLKDNAVSQSLGIVNATFSQSAGVVKVATLTLADETTGNTNTLNATYNLNGGTVNAQLITPGANKGNRNLNWTNGVIANYDAATDLTITAGLNLNLSTTGSPAFSIGNGRNGFVNSVISGSGSLAVTGGGTLTLVATNTYTGITTITNGALLVNGMLGTNMVIVGLGGLLGGIGNIPAAVTVQSGGAVQNGAGTLRTATLNLGNNGSALSYSQFTVGAGGWINATNLNVTGTNVVNILDASLAPGTNVLFTYNGAIGGSSGFNGLKLGTLPPGLWGRLQNTGSAVQLVVSALVPPVLSGTASYNAGTFQFSFSGTNGQGYHIVWSPDITWPMSNWIILAGGTFGTGVVNYADATATNSQGFYRVTSP